MKVFVSYPKFWVTGCLLALILLNPLESFGNKGSDAEIYSWPIQDVNVQGRIASTLGEYRRDPPKRECRRHRRRQVCSDVPQPPRLHKGVDIGAAGRYTDVVAVVSGILVEKGASHVLIQGGFGGTYGYFHVTPDSKLPKLNSPIEKGAILGRIKDMKDPHLHFEENRGGSNPLRDGGVDSLQG